jgi:uncharacterized membrane protein YgcG
MSKKGNGGSPWHDIEVGLKACFDAAAHSVGFDWVVVSRLFVEIFERVRLFGDEAERAKHIAWATHMANEEELARMPILDRLVHILAEQARHENRELVVSNDSLEVFAYDAITWEEYQCSRGNAVMHVIFSALRERDAPVANVTETTSHRSYLSVLAAEKRRMDESAPSDARDLLRVLLDISNGTKVVCVEEMGDVAGDVGAAGMFIQGSATRHGGGGGGSGFGGGGGGHACGGGGGHGGGGGGGGGLLAVEGALLLAPVVVAEEEMLMSRNTMGGGRHGECSQCEHGTHRGHIERDPGVSGSGADTELSGESTGCHWMHHHHTHGPHTPSATHSICDTHTTATNTHHAHTGCAFCGHGGGGGGSGGDNIVSADTGAPGRKRPVIELMPAETELLLAQDEVLSDDDDDDEKHQRQNPAPQKMTRIDCVEQIVVTSERSHETSVDAATVGASAVLTEADRDAFVAGMLADFEADAAPPSADQVLAQLQRADADTVAQVMRGVALDVITRTDDLNVARWRAEHGVVVPLTPLGETHVAWESDESNLLVSVNPDQHTVNLVEGHHHHVEYGDGDYDDVTYTMAMNAQPPWPGVHQTDYDDQRRPPPTLDQFEAHLSTYPADAIPLRVAFVRMTADVLRGGAAPHTFDLSRFPLLGGGERALDLLLAQASACMHTRILRLANCVDDARHGNLTGPLVTRLASVFPYVGTLDLTGTRICHQVAVGLATRLSHTPSLTKLVLRDCGLQGDAQFGLSQLLELDIAGNPDASEKEIARCTRLTSLTLGGSGGRAMGRATFESFVPQIPLSVVHLHIEHVAQFDLADLWISLGGRHQRTLGTLAISDTPLEPGRPFYHFPASGVPALTTLQFRRTGITSDVAEAIIDGIGHYARNLEALEITGVAPRAPRATSGEPQPLPRLRRLTLSAMDATRHARYTPRSLRERFPRLEYLDMSDDGALLQKTLDAGIRQNHLKPHDPMAYTEFHTLRLERCHLIKRFGSICANGKNKNHPRHVRSVAPVVIGDVEHPRVRHLVLSHNIELGQVPDTALVAQISACRDLTTLALAGCNIRHHTMVQLIACIHHQGPSSGLSYRQVRLTELDISNNWLDERQDGLQRSTSGVSLAAFLRHTTSLRRLIARSCVFGLEDFLSLVCAATKTPVKGASPSLDLLDVRDTPDVTWRDVYTERQRWQGLASTTEVLCDFPIIGWHIHHMQLSANPINT